MSDHPHEIFIIKRHHGGHDDHHGGAWKIAFADFMCGHDGVLSGDVARSARTTRRAPRSPAISIPVRLVDATTQPRGLHDTKKDESGITADSVRTTSRPTKSRRTRSRPAMGAPAGRKGRRPRKRKNRSKGRKGGGASRDRKSVSTRPCARTLISRSPRSPRPEGRKRCADARQETHAVAPVIGRRGGDAFRDPFEPQPVAVGRGERSRGPS